MATLKEQLRTEQERLRRAEVMLESARAAAKRAGKTTTPAVEKATKAISGIKKTISKLNADIATKAAAKREERQTPEERQAAAEKAAKTNLPFPVDDKIWNEMKTFIPNISTETFNLGGVGANIFVYQGQKTGTTTSPTGGTYKTKVDNTALANNVVNSFWTDPGIQRKVMNALTAAGNPNATMLDAFATWQSVVQQSATLYNAGRGPKFTPMDILNMSLSKSGGAKTGPDVTTYLDMPTDRSLKEVLRNGIFDIIKKEPDENDPAFQNIFNQVKQLYAKGVTTTTTVNPKTGKKTVTRTPDVTQADIDAIIQKNYKNTTDWLEAKSIDAFDKFSQWQRG